MEDQLAAVLEWLKVRADGTEKFILEQAPLYVQEVVVWQFWGSLVTAIASGLACIAVVACAIKFVRWTISAEFTEAMPFVMFAVIPLAGFGTAFWTSTQAAIKARVAPRVVIVEHLRQQTNK